MPEKAALAVEGLRKVYRVREPGKGLVDFAAVQGISFSVPAGGSLGIVGESGSGKTTVAQMIIGLVRPTEGRIFVAGVERRTGGFQSGRERRRRGRETSIVFQDPYSSLDPSQSARQAIDEVLQLHFSLDKRARRIRTQELLDQVHLDKRQSEALPSALSGGQRQRVAIARALAAEPSILILDEAVSALDVSVQAQVLNLLREIRAETNVSYLFISHDLAVVRHVSEEVIVMKTGRVVEQGATQSVLDHPKDPYTQLLLDSIPRPGWRPRRRLA
ncbi:MAG: ABC transporter ATP-binding protein [Candidatus Leucobacter sulfamidivorax]|nr:ABC transporter ATP-binding protein [Candidatus Leucobacter sulfamidivorax]